MVSGVDHRQPHEGRREEGLQAVAAADFHRHEGIEATAGVFLHQAHRAHLNPWVGDAFLPDERRPHLAHQGHRGAVVQVPGIDHGDRSALAIEALQIE